MVCFAHCVTTTNSIDSSTPGLNNKRGSRILLRKQRAEGLRSPISKTNLYTVGEESENQVPVCHRPQEPALEPVFDDRLDGKDVVRDVVRTSPDQKPLASEDRTSSVAIGGKKRDSLGECAQSLRSRPVSMPISGLPALAENTDDTRREIEPAEALRGMCRCRHHICCFLT